MSEYERCVVFQVWDKRTGERIEVGADRDGLSITEIRAVSSDGKVAQSVLVTDLPLLIACLQDYQRARETGAEPNE